MKNICRIETLLILLVIIFGNIENVEAKFPNDPISEFMQAIGEKKYNKLPSTFSPNLKKIWENSDFSKDIINIRNEIGETWEPDEVSSMNWQTQNGVVIQKVYRLQSNFRSNYTFSFNSREIDGAFKIALLNASAPYKEGIPRKVVEASKSYVSKIQLEKYSEAQKMVLPKFRSQFSDDIYKTVRSLLITKSNDPAELNYEGFKTLYNGVWYDTVTITPAKGGFMQHFNLYLSLVDEAYSIVSFEFRNPQRIN